MDAKILIFINKVRCSYSDRIAQVVERDASNIKVVCSILTAVKVFFTFPVETHSLESTFTILHFRIIIIIKTIFIHAYPFHNS